MDEKDKRAAAKLRALWVEYKKKNKGVSQETFASRAGMTQSAFSQFLQGRVPMRVSPVIKLAQLFGIPPSEIRADLPDMVYSNARHTPALQAKDSALETLSPDALQVAKAYAGMSPQGQDLIRELVYSYAFFDRTHPWLRRGRPKSKTYDAWEKWHQDNYRAEPTLEAARIEKKSTKEDA